MIQALLFLSSPEMWSLLFIVAGIMMIIGFQKAALTLFGSALLFALFSPFIDTLINALPTWVLIILMIFCGMSLFRLIFGQRVGDHLIAHLLYDFIRMPFRFFGWLFRGSGRRI